jgi:hypothetical protein
MMSTPNYKKAVKMREFIAASFFILSFIGCGSTQTIDNGKNVIFITLDGVRWQEVFHGSDPKLNGGATESVVFKKLFQRLSTSGLVMGDRDSGSEMTVSNPYNISLPAYYSMMTGATQSCDSNGCERTPTTTLQETILKELNLQPIQVASIASWAPIELAVQHEENKTFVNTGNYELNDGSNDAELSSINQLQTADHPSGSSVRHDQYTFMQAMRYLKKNKPRFLYMSLNDADELAHAGDYPGYIKVLTQYDEWISEIFDALADMSDYGQATTVMITTDHGRGNGNKWTDHGTNVPESKYIWLYAGGSHFKRVATPNKNYNHNYIRPTIQALLNMDPSKCEDCSGLIISEISEAVDQTAPISSPSASPHPSSR